MLWGNEMFEHTSCDVTDVWNYLDRSVQYVILIVYYNKSSK